MKLKTIAISTVGTFSLIIGLILIIRTLSIKPRPKAKVVCKPQDRDYIHVNGKRLIRFQDALKFRTISREWGDQEFQELKKLQKFIYKSFPLLHNSSLVEFEVVNEYSLLYKIQGKNSSLKPFMLTAHIDVVPIAESESEWIAPPFSGEIIDGFIYSRGTIDDKNMVMAILEAVSFALESGFEFERTLYLAFGHDEEVGGFTGAKRIGELLGKRGVKLEYLLDEGTFIIDDVLPNYLVDSPVAMISVAEKGIVTLNLSVTTEGGHSSMPPRENSIVILSQAIERLHNQLQPNLFGAGPEKQFVEHLAPHLPFYARVIAANLWLFRPLVAYAFGRKPSTDSICRTTTAVTKFKSGIKDNVVSPKAEACVNHRIHPADSVKEVIDRDIQIIGDSRIKTTIKVSLEPSPVSPSDETAFGYHAIAESLNQVFSDTKLITAPSTMVANTDTRHYWHLTKNIYRFSPTKMKMEDLKRFHGVNERIGVKNYEQTINFYYHLILNSNSERLRIVQPHEEL